jgi:hypothetical protein
MLCIDWDEAGDGLQFEKEGEGAVVPVAEPQPRLVAQAARATGGRAVEAPSTAAAQHPVALPTGPPSGSTATRRKKENES